MDSPFLRILQGSYLYFRFKSIMAVSTKTKDEKERKRKALNDCLKRMKEI